MKPKIDILIFFGNKVRIFRKEKCISQESISNYYSGLFDDINSQTFNTPIDLFIEDFLYQEYANLRP